MKLKIKKIREVCSTNILGKPLKVLTYYCIYQPTLFGKKWLFYKPLEGGKFKVMLERYYNSGYSKTFRTHGSAANFIKGIEANPDNYIRVTELDEWYEAMFKLSNQSVNQ